MIELADISRKVAKQRNLQTASVLVDFYLIRLLKTVLSGTSKAMSTAKMASQITETKIMSDIVCHKVLLSGDRSISDGHRTLYLKEVTSAIWNQIELRGKENILLRSEQRNTQS